MTFGDDCQGELKKYKFQAKGNEVKCKNRADTCERSLCECDKLMAQEHSYHSDIWDQQYHLFWGDWKPEQQCSHVYPASTERAHARACCNGRKNGAAFALYNLNRQECCDSGEVANIGEC